MSSPSTDTSDPARPLGKRERTKQANREEILRAAIEAFTELGFGATTVRDIVRRTTLASGTFYNYFPDKDAILHEIAAEHVREADERMQAARATARTPAEAVERGAAAYFGILVERPDLLALFRRNSGSLRAFADDALLHVVVDALRDDLDRLGAGAATPLDTELLAAGLIGAGMEIAMRFAERGGQDPTAALAALRALVVDGVLGRIAD
ncbi:TetR/AcrR family transcriptional regulator [Patulibacter brassicae]|jgi:AcrR family transcriptional regulator|uniref:TetR/AcrR family transcriptional regulator n=1 Tax=Patulibacter brassicae TaxID=1705717 RepID=A0ABU4VMC4_9ACTN|nr:TetR/AcrR family transcriptional regulator [Patulibacter brassicae]MDX8152997.1 TetR/AcrR family transcriptional regulator [Patulibacter brassicae]